MDLPDAVVVAVACFVGVVALPRCRDRGAAVPGKEAAAEAPLAWPYGVEPFDRGQLVVGAERLRWERPVWAAAGPLASQTFDFELKFDEIRICSSNFRNVFVYCICRYLFLLFC